MSQSGTNRVTIAQFAKMTDTEIDALDNEEMYELQGELDAYKRDAAALAKRHTAAVLRRCEDTGRATLKAKGKDTGSLTLPGADGFNYKFEVPKKVEWDQDKLRDIVYKMAAAGKKFKEIEEYVTITFSVAEARYNAWPSEIKACYQDARTVRDGALKAEIVEAKK